MRPPAKGALAIRGIVLMGKQPIMTHYFDMESFERAQKRFDRKGYHTMVVNFEELREQQEAANAGD